METSLRYGYGKDSRALRIHAKEKIRIDSNTFFQVHGELDTQLGQPSSLSALIRHFYPDLSATLGVGVRYDKRDRLRYTVSAKKTFPVTVDGLLNFKIKEEVQRSCRVFMEHIQFSEGPGC
ncbi:outer envelope pore protein 21, chloroplastic isoform X2 [Abrus precatorius]|uniref:Outer envelope pore protein 21, chloroplastic isoform X2 n=1 Tax=Abrus precatorius TaxID=3816 RepID=A0A8B8LGG9_ABRPR|nr:outer envelope pore protein 21, chloroplastic isoform X2 [Abrus precatorius]